MTRRTVLPDDMVDQLLGGRPSAGAGSLVGFVDDVRASARREVCPSGALTVLLADGLVAIATSAEASTGPAAQGPTHSTRRKNRMIPDLLAKLAAASLVVKAAAATGAVALAGTAAAATGTMPDLPEQLGGSSDAVVEVDEETEGRQDADVRQDDEAPGGDVGEEVGGPEDNFGADVQAILDGRGDGGVGEAVSVAARAMADANAAAGRKTGTDASAEGQANRPEDTPDADENPGTDASAEGQANRPEDTPDADENPGTDEGEAPDPLPTAETNPGTEASEDGGRTP